MGLKFTSDSPQQQQDDQGQKDQSDSAAGIGSPGLTVAPGGHGAGKQDDSHDFSPLLFFEEKIESFLSIMDLFLKK